MSIFEKRVKNRNNVITSHVNYNDFYKNKQTNKQTNVSYNDVFPIKKKKKL